MPFIIQTTPTQPTAITTGASPTSPITPHVQMPFRLGANGRPKYCDQDSAEDVQSCVLNLLSCPQGDNPYDADFGRPDLRGDPEPLQLQALTNAVATYETRLNDLSADESLSMVLGIVQILVSGDVSS